MKNINIKVLNIIITFLTVGIFNDSFATFETMVKEVETSVDYPTAYLEGSDPDIGEREIRLLNAWDRKLNEMYQKLLKNKNVSNKKALINAQQSWIKFRDAENSFFSSTYRSSSGTLWKSKIQENAIKIVKKRVEELLNYINLLEDEYCPR